MKILNMNLHIGSLIKKRAQELRIGPTELGSKIDTSKQNMYGIYKRKSIDIELLYKISVALNYNFFNHYSDFLNQNYSTINNDFKSDNFSNQNIQDIVNGLKANINLLNEDVRNLQIDIEKMKNKE